MLDIIHFNQEQGTQVNKTEFNFNVWGFILSLQCFVHLFGYLVKLSDVRRGLNTHLEYLNTESHASRGTAIIIFLPMYALKEFCTFDSGNYKVILPLITGDFELLCEKQGP